MKAVMRSSWTKRTLVATALLLVLLVAAGAAGGVDLYANGTRVISQPGVVVEQGVSYGPLRAVAEAIGAQVEWHEDRQMAVVCRGTWCVQVKAGEGILRERRLLLPIRKLAEKLGGMVQWTGGDNPRIDLTMPPAE